MEEAVGALSCKNFEQWKEGRLAMCGPSTFDQVSVCVKLQLAKLPLAPTCKAPANSFWVFSTKLTAPVCGCIFSHYFLCEVFSAFNQAFKSNQPMFFMFFQPSISQQLPNMLSH